MASVWGELKGRNVVKVAVAYAIVGWLPAVSFVSTSSMADEYDDVVIADAHIHLLDFLQNGDYLENGEIVKKVPGAALLSINNPIANKENAKPLREIPIINKGIGGLRKSEDLLNL